MLCLSVCQLVGYATFLLGYSEIKALMVHSELITITLFMPWLFIFILVAKLNFSEYSTHLAFHSCYTGGQLKMHTKERRWHELILFELYTVCISISSSNPTFINTLMHRFKCVWLDRKIPILLKFSLRALGPAPRFFHQRIFSCLGGKVWPYHILGYLHCKLASCCLTLDTMLSQFFCHQQRLRQTWSSLQRSVLGHALHLDTLCIKMRARVIPALSPLIGRGVKDELAYITIMSQVCSCR